MLYTCENWIAALSKFTAPSFFEGEECQSIFGEAVNEWILPNGQAQFWKPEQ